MLFIVIMIAIWIVALVGWILNIVKIVKGLKVKKENTKAVTPFFIDRCVGVIAAPLGEILGYMNG